MKQRVVVTGMGVITPIGTSCEAFFENALKGQSGVRAITAFNSTEEYSNIAGIVDKAVDYNTFPEIRDALMNKSRIKRFAIASTYQALSQANLFNRKELLLNCSVYVATAIADIISMEAQYLKASVRDEQYDWAKHDADLFDSNAFNFNSICEDIAASFELKKNVNTIVTGCTGGVDSVGYAYRQIQEGYDQIAIAGSVDCPITPFTVGSFSKINATSMRNDAPQKASRPFDRDRDGFVLGEGCGILILESLEHALKRGAPILAQITGYGSCNNGEHMTNINPDGEALSRAIGNALESIQINVADIDFINLHGSSTPQNDVAESNALEIIFGDRAKSIPVTSTKSLIGHPLSASNSIEIISSICSIQSGFIHPTINLDNQDPKCKLNVITSTRNRKYEINKVLKVSSGFSGIHSALVISKYK